MQERVEGFKKKKKKDVGKSEQTFCTVIMKIFSM